MLNANTLLITGDRFQMRVMGQTKKFIVQKDQSGGSYIQELGIKDYGTLTVGISAKTTFRLKDIIWLNPDYTKGNSCNFN